MPALSWLSRFSTRRDLVLAGGLDRPDFRPALTFVLVPLELAAVLRPLGLYFLAALAASDLARWTSALIRYSLRSEGQPGTPLRLAIAARSLTVRDLSLAVVIKGLTSGLPIAPFGAGRRFVGWSILACRP